MHIAATLVLLVVSTNLPAQEPQLQPQTPNTVRLAADAPRPKAQIKDLAWLAGRWEGEGLGGTMDEVWSDRPALPAPPIR